MSAHSQHVHLSPFKRDISYGLGILNIAIGLGMLLPGDTLTDKSFNHVLKIMQWTGQPEMAWGFTWFLIGLGTLAVVRWPKDKPFRLVFSFAVGADVTWAIATLLHRVIDEHGLYLPASLMFLAYVRVRMAWTKDLGGNGRF